jgi:hypothetical protein
MDNIFIQRTIKVKEDAGIFTTTHSPHLYSPVLFSILKITSGRERIMEYLQPHLLHLFHKVKNNFSISQIFFETFF